MLKTPVNQPRRAVPGSAISAGEYNKILDALKALGMQDALAVAALNVIPRDKFFPAVILPKKPPMEYFTTMTDPVSLPPLGEEGANYESMDDPQDERYWFQEVEFIGTRNASGSWVGNTAPGRLCWRPCWNRGRIGIATNLAELSLSAADGFRHKIVRPRVYQSETLFYSNRSPDEENASAAGRSGSVRYSDGQVVMIHRRNDISEAAEWSVGIGSTTPPQGVKGEQFVFSLAIPEIRSGRFLVFAGFDPALAEQIYPLETGFIPATIPELFATDYADFTFGWYGGEVDSYDVTPFGEEMDAAGIYSVPPFTLPPLPDPDDWGPPRFSTEN